MFNSLKFRLEFIKPIYPMNILNITYTPIWGWNGVIPIIKSFFGFSKTGNPFVVTKKIVTFDKKHSKIFPYGIQNITTIRFCSL